MPAAATALATRSCSSFIARARSSVPPLAGSAPILSIAAITSGSFTITAISLAIFCTISRGVPVRANRPWFTAKL